MTVITIDDRPDYSKQYEQAQTEKEIHHLAAQNIIDLHNYIDRLIIQIIASDGYLIKVIDLRRPEIKSDKE